MQLLQMRLSQPRAVANAANDRAESNWAANLDALGATQPWVVEQIAQVAPEADWVFARDGSLTGMLSSERWWAGCSLPTRAAQFMLRTLDVGGTVACFLAPAHAAQLRVALDLLEPRQAIVAIVPEERALSVILHCDDFSREIIGHRLWFAAGEAWVEQLRRVFEEQPGLPTPAQFIRPILAESKIADRLIGPSQKVFADEASRRSDRIQSVVQARTRPTCVGRVCVIAPSHFRFWESAAAEVLADLLCDSTAPNGLTCIRLDTDDPASASPLALASAAAEADAVIAPNIFRADAPGIAAADLPWVTWVTSPRIGPFDPKRPRDGLIVADPSWQSAAEQSGWPRQRVHLGGWPAWPSVHSNDNPSTTLTLIADTQPIEPPEQVTDYSSQRLLWEMIQAELANDPFLVGDDAASYLADRVARRQIAEQGFDRGVFIERLIVLGYQQGLARILIASGLPLRIFGKGWDRIDEFAPHSGGPVRSRQQLREIVDGSAALIHAWPSRHVHPIDAAGRPVLRAAGRPRDAFLREARSLVNGTAVSSVASTSPLSALLLREILQAV